MLNDVIILVQFSIFYKDHKKSLKMFSSIYFSPGRELLLTPGMGMGGGNKSEQITTNHNKSKKTCFFYICTPGMGDRGGGVFFL